MKKYALSSLILLIQLAIANSVIAQEIFFNRVLPPEGKTFMHVTGMVQDRQGYMWLATKNGLFRYDGYDMIHLTHDPLDTNSLALDALEAICTDATGALWIATLGAGLERFDPYTGVFTHFRHNPNNPASLSADWVTAVLVDKEGVLWVGTNNGLNRFVAQTGMFIHYHNQPNDPTSISSNSVVALYEDQQGMLWIGTGSVYHNKREEGGLNCLKKKTGKFTRYLHDPKNPHTLIDNRVRAIFEDSRGTFWVGTAGDGLHTLNRKTGAFQRLPYDPVHPEKLSRPPIDKLFGENDHITFIKEDAAGAIWIGTSESGLNYFDPETKKITHYESEKDTAGAFTSRTGWSAFTSREGVLWISTLHGELFRTNPFKHTIPFYQSSEGAVYTFYEEPNGIFWKGSVKGGLVQHDPHKGTLKRFINDPLNTASLSDNFVQALKADHQGNLWVGTANGLQLLDKKRGTFIHYRHDPKISGSLSNNFIRSIIEDSKRNLWVGTARGLNRMDRKTGSFKLFLFYPKDTIWLGPNLITSVLEDRQGQIWAGGYQTGGIHQLNPVSGKFKAYLKGIGIYCIYEDASGTLWAGGANLFYYNRNSDTFNKFVDSSETTEINGVSSMIEDDQKNLWMASAKGILKINPQRNQTIIYGKHYGVVFNSAYKGRNGNIYFGHEQGYYAFSPDLVTKGLKAPEILFSGFRLSDRPVKPDKNGPLKEPFPLIKEIRLHHNQNIFSFDFAAIDYTNPEENRHYFMLENYDKGWNRAGSNRKALYFNVPPGNYVFKVKAANGNGLWAEKSINIVIVPPWWSTWWFRVPAVILGITLFYGGIRWRIQLKFRRQLERFEREKQLADFRHKTAELEMQALRSQMNPHFIFNSLNSINDFILQKDKNQASEYLTKFSRLVRLILQNSQAALIPLECELEALQLYLELESLRFNNHFDFAVKTDDDLDVAALKIPPLLIQPYAENAIWHGLMHKKEKGHLSIELTEQDKMLNCRIADDGIGRKKAAALKPKSRATHRSLGMRITADRIALLQQQKLIKVSTQINDLVLPDGSAGGTEVILKLPIRYD